MFWKKKCQCADLKLTVKNERLITDEKIRILKQELNDAVSLWQENVMKQYDAVWEQSRLERLANDAAWKKETDIKHEKFQNDHREHAQQLESYLKTFIDINRSVSGILALLALGEKPK